MCPNWVSRCAPWLDIPAGCSVVHSGPMVGAHYIQPIAFVTECRRFGLMQFPSSQLPFFILALRLFHHSRSLLSAGCKFGFCRNLHAVSHELRAASLGLRVIVVHPYSPPFPPLSIRLPIHPPTCPPIHPSHSSFLAFSHLLFVLAPGLLRVYRWCLLEQFALA